MFFFNPHINRSSNVSTYQRIRPTFPIRKPWIESGKRRRREKSIQILDHRITNEGWEGRPKIDSRECGSVFYDGSRSTRHNSDLGSLNCFISNSSTTSNDTRRIKAADRPVGVAFSLESSSSLRFALLYYRCCSLTPTLWPHRRGNYTGRGRCNWVTASPTIRDTLRLSLCVWRGDYLNNNLVSRWKKKCVTTSSVVEEGGPSTTLMIIHSDDCSR